tara:strand:+ start:70 stop:828 length:759 start_codon:yes stop_codon:yes gene_type:complete
MIAIELDYREKKLIDQFKNNKNNKNNQNYIISNLDIGDIIIKYNEHIIYIIERKTISDLCSSILDGRYREQKERLLSNFNTCQIIYIIEGDYKTYKNPIPYKTILSTIVNSNLRDNISVLYSKNINDTYDYINLITKKIEKKELNISNIETTETTETNNNIELNKSGNINNIIKVKKKDNLTPNIYYLTILSQIPGCSINIAKEIQKYAPSILDLYIKYNEEGIDKLQNIIIGKKKLGSKIATKIINYLFNC